LVRVLLGGQDVRSKISDEKPKKRRGRA